MDLFPLPLFPDGSLRESVVTTVWVGVFVISFFNLRFGWTYSGLVIPGYLVPLLLTNPTCAVITLAEGILAYGLVYLISEYLSRFGGWCNFFGRDRFFALLLSAVLVRVGMDGWFLPLLAGWLDQHLALALDYKGSLHSFGLIIVALVANQFWKTGFWKGLTPFLVTLGITFVLIRFVLMTTTNFNVGHLTYIYSNSAASLLASPKSYIILIITGFVASRMNLRYGWEYNGILIPALLALQWYEPLKIVSSLVEAGVVYLVADWLLKTRLFRGTTIEGARKLLLFFNVAYLYRLCLGYVLPFIAPEVVADDYYGFAYLLSSLIALKMHGKQIVLRLSRATIQTSFGAAVAANLIGFWLASVFGSVPLAAPKPGEPPPQLQASVHSMDTLATREKLRLLVKRERESVVMPTPGELNRFREALELIRTHADSGAPEPLRSAQVYLDQLHYSIERVQPNALCLREREPLRGWGLYFIDLDRPNGLLLEVPAPLDEEAAVEAAVNLYQSLHASSLAIAGGSRLANLDGSADVLANAATPFHTFHQVFGRRNVLQIRGDTASTRARLQHGPTQSALYVKAELPRSLSLRSLEDQLGDFDVVWKPVRLANAQRRQTRSGFAELWLSRADRIGLKANLSTAALSGRPPLIPEQGLIREWVLHQKPLMASAGSDQYQPASQEEMLFFDEEILTPLLAVAQRGYELGGLSPQAEKELQAINWSAALFGYQVDVHHDASLDQDFLVLAESSSDVSRRFWGTFVRRLGTATPYIVEVPRPLYDLNTLEFGLHLFDRLQGEALLLAGSHSEANQDQTSDPLDFRNSTTLFSLVNQVVLREARGQRKMAIQCRGFSPAPGLEQPDLLLAFPDGISEEPLLTPLGRSLVEGLTSNGIRLQLVDGSPLAAGYEISSMPQAQYATDAARQEFAIVWLSQALRDAFRSQDGDYALHAQLATLGVPVIREDVATWLHTRFVADQQTQLPEPLKRVLDRYVATLNIVTLQKAMQDWSSYGFQAVLDRNSGQLLLAISEGPASLPVLLNLRARENPPGAAPADADARLDWFIASRSRWLEWSL